MTLSEFKKKTVIINGVEADNIRNRYISSFISTTSDYYIKRILVIQSCSDGMCYTGYLWDCLKDAEVIDFSYIQSMAGSLEKVYVLWDIHSKDRIISEGYWKFEKNDVLLLDFSILLDNLDYLPDDIYIFNNNFNWTLVLTHEHIDNKRWCLKTGNI